MSQENIDVYFAAKDRLAAGDHDGFAKLLHPDVTATVMGLPEPGPFVGRDGVLAQLERLGLEFDGQRYADVEIVADRDGWIVLTYRWSVRGSRSGVDVDADITVAFRVENSQLIEVHWRETRDDALAAAGLRESSVSQENMQLVRSICAAWDRGDYGSFAWAHPDIEFTIVDGPSPGTSIGLAGMAEGWRAWLSAWEDFSQEADEYREVDDERVLVSFRCSGRGKTSGLDLAQMHPLMAGVFHLREGMVTRFVGYIDYADALEAVGLRE